MPVIGITLIIQIICAIHIVKTGKEVFWIYIVLFLPGIGAAIYFFTQVLPQIGQSRGVHTAKNSLIKAIDPQRELRKRKAQLELANTLDNKLKLAEECFEANLLDDAIELFQSCLTGVGEGDADTMIKLAKAYFAQEEYQLTINTLDDIKTKNPNYKSTEGHLLYARSLEMQQKTEQALSEYAVVSESYPGEEGRIRFALLLLKEERQEEARTVFEKSIKRYHLSPKFYQKKEKHWIKIAQANLKNLE